MNEAIQLNNKTVDNNTVNKIMAIEQEVALMGGNDSEISNLDELIKSFQKGELSSRDALEQAEKIRDRKQDYH